MVAPYVTAAPRVARVLIATDGTPACDAAVRIGRALARRDGLPFELLTVFEPIPIYDAEVAPLLEGAERAYVCGSVGFSSYATRLLGELGVPRAAVRVEQFGATS